MGRPLRSDIEGAWYHVVNRGAARGTVFFDDRDRHEFERLLTDVHERFGVVVHAYCWMTNHYHLLLECPGGDLSRAMHRLGSLYVRHVNDRHGRDGPLFRDRYFAKTVTTDAYLLTLVRYIHRNPLPIVGPGRLDSYRWSSLRVYLGRRRRPDWLRTETVTELCGGPAAASRYIREGVSGAGIVVDGAAVLGLIDVVVDDFADSIRGRRPQRTIAVALLDRVGPDVGREMLRALAFPTAAAESMARSRARQQLRDRPELGVIAETVLRLAA